MKKTPFEENKQSIRDLLDSIIPGTKIDSLINSHESCLFFLDIESYSLINKYFDFILWLIFFIIMDFVIFMQSFPNNFFASLNKHVADGQQNTPAFIQMRLSLQQASILINFTIFFSVIYQWYKFFNYKTNKHLNHKIATFLHFTVMYLPIIMTPILGIFFGANIIVNQNNGFYSRDGILLGLYILISSILFLVNHLIYTYFVKYSLILKNNFFAYWNPPFQIIDFIYFFSVSLLFTFRSGPLEEYTTISGILGIFYGSWSIYKLKYTTFIYSTGKYFFLKLVLDSVLFGLLTIINIWVKISFLSSSITSFLLFLITGIVSYLIIGPGNEKYNSDLSNNNFKDFSSKKFRNAAESLFTLRNAATFSVIAIADPNFIQFLAHNRFSPELITDIIRLSIYADFDLSSITIPQVLLSPYDLIPFKYMTFQYKLFEHMTKRNKIELQTDLNLNEAEANANNNNNSQENSLEQNKPNEKNEDATVLDVFHKLQQEKQRAEEILDTFWTENDSKQLNIYELGLAIKGISDEFSLYGSIYKQCENIQNIWSSFAVDVLFMPSAQKIEPNILDMFVYPRKGLLTYLINYSSILPKVPTISQTFSASATFDSKGESNDSVDSTRTRGQSRQMTNSPSYEFSSITDFSDNDLKNTKRSSHFFDDGKLISDNGIYNRPEKSELEKYFKTFQLINIRPILVLFVVTTILICGSAIFFGIISNSKTRKALDEIVNIADLMLMSLTISGQLVSDLDSFIIYPPTEVISTVLNLTSEEARLFRSQRIEPCDFQINIDDNLDKVKYNTLQFIMLEDCPTPALSLFTKYKVPANSTMWSKKCYYYGTLYFLESIKKTATMYMNQQQKKPKLIIPNYAILIIFCLFFIVVFIAFYFIFDNRMHNYFLKAVAHISCSGSNKNFTERTDFSFSFIVQFLNFLILVACFVLMFYGHYLPIEALKKRADNFANITFALGVISLRIQETMSSLFIKILENPKLGELNLNVNPDPGLDYRSYLKKYKQNQKVSSMLSDLEIYSKNRKILNAINYNRKAYLELTKKKEEILRKLDKNKNDLKLISQKEKIQKDIVKYKNNLILLEKNGKMVNEIEFEQSKKELKSIDYINKKMEFVNNEYSNSVKNAEKMPSDNKNDIKMHNEKVPNSDKKDLKITGEKSANKPAFKILKRKTFSFPLRDKINLFSESEDIINDYMRLSETVHSNYFLDDYQYSYSNLGSLIFDSSITAYDPAEIISLLCQEIIFMTNSMTFLKEFPSNFNVIPMLKNWSSPDSFSFSTLLTDWSTLGLENMTEYTIESFKFLYSRYVFINILSNFIQNSYPKGVEICFVNIMKDTFSDWYITVLTIIISFIFLSFYVYIHKRKKIWFYGASLLLRRRINKDQRFIVSMRQILENGEIPEILDLLPFAAIIKDEKNIILDSNWRVQKFTKLTTRQLIGQNYNEIFNWKRMLKVSPRNIEITEFKNKKNHQDLIVMRENTGLENIKESLNHIIKRFNFQFKFKDGFNPKLNLFYSKNNLVVFNNAVYIEIKLEATEFKPEEAFGLFNYAEKDFQSKNGWIIKRISCGAVFYSAVCYFNDSDSSDQVFDEQEIQNKKKKIFLFFSNFLSKAQAEFAIVTATFGKVSCFSLAPDNNQSLNIDVIASGVPTFRAHEICLWGEMGRFYIDYELMNFTQINRNDIKFLFKPRVEKKKKRVTFLLDSNLQQNASTDETDLDATLDEDETDTEDPNRPVLYDLPDFVIPIMPV